MTTMNMIMRTDNFSTANDSIYNVTEKSYPCYEEDTNFGAMLNEYRSSNAHGYVASLICLIGILGNLANITVLSRPKMAESPVNFLLMIIAIADLLLVCTYLPMAAYFYIIANRPNKEPLYTDDKASAWVLYFCISFVVVCHSVAVWHTIAVASFRWLTLAFTNGKYYSTLKVARLCSLFVTISVISVTIPNWMTLGVSTITINDCHHRNAVFWTVGGNPKQTFSPIIYALVLKILPAILLTALTIPLVMIMRKAEINRRNLMTRGKREESKRHQEHNRTTGMLLVVVLIFIVVEVPHGIYIMFMVNDHSLFTMYNNLGEINDLITLIAFSINFVLYTAMSRLFRTTFVSLCCKKPLQNQSLNFRRISTMLTSIRNVTMHKRSTTTLSDISNDNLCLSHANNRARDNYLHPSVHAPLLIENSLCTRTTSFSDTQSTADIPEATV